MFSSELDIILYGIAAAIGAVTVALLLIFIQQRNYLRLAVALTLGMIFLQYIQAVLLLEVPRLQDLPAFQGSDVPAHPLLLAVLGAVMLIGAIAQFRARNASDRLNQRLNALMPRVGLVSAFAIGFVLMLTNVKNWALAIATISTAGQINASRMGLLGTYSVFVLLAQSPMLVLILVQVLAPSKSRKPLDTVSQWLTVHGNTVVAIVTGIIGIIFLSRGLPPVLQAIF